MLSIKKRYFLIFSFVLPIMVNCFSFFQKKKSVIAKPVEKVEKVEKIEKVEKKIAINFDNAEKIFESQLLKDFNNLYSVVECELFFNDIYRFYDNYDKALYDAENGNYDKEGQKKLEALLIKYQKLANNVKKRAKYLNYYNYHFKLDKTFILLNVIFGLLLIVLIIIFFMRYYFYAQNFYAQNNKEINYYFYAQNFYAQNNKEINMDLKIFHPFLFFIFQSKFSLFYANILPKSFLDIYNSLKLNYRSLLDYEPILEIVLIFYLITKFVVAFFSKINQHHANSEMLKKMLKEDNNNSFVIDDDYYYTNKSNARFFYINYSQKKFIKNGCLYQIPTLSKNEYSKNHEKFNKIVSFALILNAINNFILLFVRGITTPMQYFLVLITIITEFMVRKFVYIKLLLDNNNEIFKKIIIFIIFSLGLSFLCMFLSCFLEVYIFHAIVNGSKNFTISESWRETLKNFFISIFVEIKKNFSKNILSSK